MNFEISSSRFNRGDLFNSQPISRKIYIFFLRRETKIFILLFIPKKLHEEHLFFLDKPVEQMILE